MGAVCGPSFCAWLTSTVYGYLFCAAYFEGGISFLWGLLPPAPPPPPLRDNSAEQITLLSIQTQKWFHLFIRPVLALSCIAWSLSLSWEVVWLYFFTIFCLSSPSTFADFFEFCALETFQLKSKSRGVTEIPEFQPCVKTQKLQKSHLTGNNLATSTFQIIYSVCQNFS